MPQQTHSCALGMAESSQVVNQCQLPQTQQPKPNWPLSSLTDIKFDGHWAILFWLICGQFDLRSMHVFIIRRPSILQYKLQNYRQAEKGTDWVTAVGGNTEHPEFPHAGEYPVVGSLWGMLHGILQS